MMTTENLSKYLFVYGTLMSCSTHPMAEFLNKHAILIGHAAMPGRLYNLGAYPAAIFDQKAKTKVCGELFQLKDQLFLFPELDAYEGIEAEPGKPAMYERALVEVTFKTTSVYCWTYLCREENTAIPQVKPNAHNQISWYGICPKLD